MHAKALRIFVIVAAATWSAANPASAANWANVGKKDGAQSWIDLASFSTTPKTAKFWSKTAYDTVQVQPYHGKEVRFVSTETQVEVDCETGVRHLRAALLTSADGRPTTLDPGNETSTAPPGSIPDLVAKLLCFARREGFHFSNHGVKDDWQRAGQQEGDEFFYARAVERSGRTLWVKSKAVYSPERMFPEQLKVASAVSWNVIDCEAETRAAVLVLLFGGDGKILRALFYRTDKFDAFQVPVLKTAILPLCASRPMRARTATGREY